MSVIVAGTAAFWAVCFLLFVLFLGAVAWESGWISFALVLFFLIFLTFATDAHPWNWVADNWKRCLVGLLIYMFVGVCWSVAKWTIHARHVLVEYQENEATYRANYADFLKKYEHTQPPVSYREWLSKYGFIRSEIPPNPARHKDDIMFWMAYWPGSALVTLVHEPFVWAYDSLVQVYGRISTWMFRDVNLD